MNIQNIFSKFGFFPRIKFDKNKTTDLNQYIRKRIYESLLVVQEQDSDGRITSFEFNQDFNIRDFCRLNNVSYKDVSHSLCRCDCWLSTLLSRAGNDGIDSNLFLSWIWICESLDSPLNTVNKNLDILRVDEYKELAFHVTKNNYLRKSGNYVSNLIDKRNYIEPIVNDEINALKSHTLKICLNYYDSFCLDEFEEKFDIFSEWVSAGWLSIRDFHKYIFLNEKLRDTINFLYPGKKDLNVYYVKRVYNGRVASPDGTNGYNCREILSAFGLLGYKISRTKKGNIKHTVLNEFFNKRLYIKLDRGDELFNKFESFKATMKEIYKLYVGNDTPENENECNALLLLALSTRTDSAKYGCLLDFLEKSFIPLTTDNINVEMIKFIRNIGKMKPIQFKCNYKKINFSALSVLTGLGEKTLLSRVKSRVSLIDLFKIRTGTGKIPKTKYSILYIEECIYKDCDFVKIGITGIDSLATSIYEINGDEINNALKKRQRLYKSDIELKPIRRYVGESRKIYELEQALIRVCNDNGFPPVVKIFPELRQDGFIKEAFLINGLSFVILTDDAIPYTPSLLLEEDVISNSLNTELGLIYWYPLTDEQRCFAYLSTICTDDAKVISMFLSGLGGDLKGSYKRFREWMAMPNIILDGESPEKFILNNNDCYHKLINKFKFNKEVSLIPML